MPTSRRWLRDSNVARRSAAAGALLLLLTVPVQVASAQVGSAHVLSTQSLGEVAQREAERRAQVTTGRVYTNADLVPVIDASAPMPAPSRSPSQSPAQSPARSQAPALAPAAVEATAGHGVSALTIASTPTTPAPGENAETADAPGVESIIAGAPEKRDEQYWRAKAQDLQGRLAKTIPGIAAAEARLSQIDAAPRTPTAAREHEVIAATLSRLQRDARALSDALTGLLTRARVAQVPEESTREALPAG